MFIITLTKHNSNKTMAWYNIYPIGTFFTVESIQYKIYEGEEYICLTQEHIDKCNSSLRENYNLLNSGGYYLLPVEFCTICENNISKYVSLILTELID